MNVDFIDWVVFPTSLFSVLFKPDVFYRFYFIFLLLSFLTSLPYSLSIFLCFSFSLPPSLILFVSSSRSIQLSLSFYFSHCLTSFFSIFLFADLLSSFFTKSLCIFPSNVVFLISSSLSLYLILFICLSLSLPPLYFFLSSSLSIYLTLSFFLTVSLHCSLCIFLSANLPYFITLSFSLTPYPIIFISSSLYLLLCRTTLIYLSVLLANLFLSAAEP